VTGERRWNVEIVVEEHDDHTRAEARLMVPDGPAEPAAQLRGTGESRHRRGELPAKEIEDEFAVSRALWNLAHVMWTSAVTDLESAVSRAGAR
jgi:Rv2632c-like